MGEQLVPKIQSRGTQMQIKIGTTSTRRYGEVYPGQQPNWKAVATLDRQSRTGYGRTEADAAADAIRPLAQTV